MSKGCSYFLDPGENWDKTLDLFSSLGLSDIYFDYRYLELYIDQGSNSIFHSLLNISMDFYGFWGMDASALPPALRGKLPFQNLCSIAGWLLVL